MFDTNKHKVVMLQILKEIYSDLELANCLGFKGGTALFFFYDLPRFSVDLDFNLLKSEKENDVYNKVRNIISKYGKIEDEAKKFFGPVFLLNYGNGERNLKIEISNREWQFENHYEILNYIGINMLVMTGPDMFANKLCTLLDRKVLTNRDIFDCWFFMQKKMHINKQIIEIRMNKPYADYLQDCINSIEKLSGKNLLNGLGELVSQETKTFVRNKLHSELLFLLRFYKDFPI
ncbi:MAG: nucleotidyl transferase AbiEii/AbiGii toxin family protein [Bacteroidales bacterium]|jgi:predicted nucleotidyltransferase component of viral defense system|nr:nucleotidyl transferase AbiEii/AbiGii toxin family protein [Bacteroidales bacterium]